VSRMVARTLVVAMILACSAFPARARLPNAHVQRVKDKAARRRARPGVRLLKLRQERKPRRKALTPKRRSSSTLGHRREDRHAPKQHRQQGKPSPGASVTTAKRAVQDQPPADYSFLKELGWGKPLVRRTTVLTGGDPRLGLAARRTVTRTTAPSWKDKASVLRRVRAKFEQLQPGQIRAIQEIANDPNEHLGTRQAAQELLARPPEPGSVENLQARFHWPGPHASWYEKVEFLTRVHQGDRTLSVSQLELIDKLSRSRNRFVKRAARAILKDPPHPGSWRSLYGRFYSPLSGPLEWHRMTDFLNRVHKSGLRLSREQLAHIRRLTRSKEPYVADYARRILREQAK
jgi:hypothetical protein